MEEQKISGLSIKQTREIVAKRNGVKNNAKKHKYLRRSNIVLYHETIGGNDRPLRNRFKNARKTKKLKK